MSTMLEDGCVTVVVETLENGAPEFLGSAWVGIGCTQRVLGLVAAAPASASVIVARRPSTAQMSVRVIDGSMVV